MISWEGYVDLIRSDNSENKEHIRLLRTGSPSRMSYDASPSREAYRPTDFDPNCQHSNYEACGSVKYVSPQNISLSLEFLTTDEFLDLTNLKPTSDDFKLPRCSTKLLTDSLLQNDLQNKSTGLALASHTFRKPLSTITPNGNTSKSQFGLFKAHKSPERIEQDIETFRNIQTQSSFLLAQTFETGSLINPEPLAELQTSSATKEHIKIILECSTNQPDLIGDFSKPHHLSIIPGRHPDLKSITPATLAKLINGEYSDCIDSFKVLDCRYPYEFEGGHITGTENIYTRQQIIDELMNRKTASPETVQSVYKRDILVFHCEFSSERSANLYRYLRSSDRTYNKDFYPYLCYPEIYLLDGGYKNFLQEHSALCTANDYVPMNHPDHKHNLQHFRKKSKTWNTDCRHKSLLRSTSFKRL